jgi:hypothetical protein
VNQCQDPGHWSLKLGSVHFALEQSDHPTLRGGTVGSTETEDPGRDICLDPAKEGQQRMVPL